MSRPNIVLNKEKLGFALALFAVFGTGITVYNWLLDGRPENSPIVKELIMNDAEQDQRLDQSDIEIARNTEALKDQTAETQGLKEAVVKLTTVIEEMNKDTARN